MGAPAHQPAERPPKSSSTGHCCKRSLRKTDTAPAYPAPGSCSKVRGQTDRCLRTWEPRGLPARLNLHTLLPPLGTSLGYSVTPCDRPTLFRDLERECSFYCCLLVRKPRLIPNRSVSSLFYVSHLRIRGSHHNVSQKRQLLKMTSRLCKLKCTGSEKGLGRWVLEETEYKVLCPQSGAIYGQRVR